MSTTTPASVGHWLKQRRKELDLTQEALAEQAGCSSETLRKIEAGRQRPSQRLAERLVAALDVPPDARPATMRLLRAHTAPAAVSPQRAAPSPAPPAPGRTHNLPVPLTALIGREADVSRLRELLLRFEARLVTVVGPPGIGKTRLALAVAHTLRDEFTSGVWFVELAPLTDSGLVLPAIAAALGISTGGGMPLERVVNYIRDRQMLVVLDNCEHLPAAADPVAALLKAAPGLTVLATSRTPLRIYGEKEDPIPALRVPDLDTPVPLEELAQYEAVRLFVERVGAIDPDFALTAENAPAVGAICVRLDGLPLAIELAAARIRVFSPQALLARLDRPLNLLRGGALSLPARQQTLRAAIEWSYDLLGPGEQQLLRRMGVFQGRVPLDAIVGVCGAGQAEPAPGRDSAAVTLDIEEGVESLAGKSLLRVRTGRDGEPRFWLLETIKEYAREKLEAHGEGEQARLRHATFFLKIADVNERTLPGPQHQVWLAQLDESLDNLRAALTWALEARTVEQRQGLALAWRAGRALGWYWHLHAHVAEARRWITALLAREADLRTLPDLDTKRLRYDKAGLLLAAGYLARQQGDLDRARAPLEESLGLFQEAGDTQFAAHVVNNLGNLMLQQGDLAAARTFHEDNLRLSRELGNQEGIARALGQLSLVAYEQGDVEGAHVLLSESLASSRTVGDWGIMIRLLSYGALILCGRGEYATAGPVWAECLEVCRAVGHLEGVGEASAGLGLVAYGQGNFAAARTLYLEALGLLPATPQCGGYLMQLAGVELELARLPIVQQDAPAMAGAQRAAPSSLPPEMARRVVRLLGAGKELLETQGSGLGNIELAIYEFSMPLAQDVLGQPGLEAAFAEGRAMTPEQVRAYALEPASGAAPRDLQSVPDQDMIVQFEAPEGAAPPPYLVFKWAAGVAAPRTERMAAAAPLSIKRVDATPRSTSPSLLPELTMRETEVLRLLAASLTDHQIAERLVVSKRTVQAHIRSIYSKLDIPNRSAATRYAIEHGLV